MFNISGMFNQKKGKTTTDEQVAPYFKDTGYSQVSGRNLVLDPSIRQITDQGLSRYSGLFGDIGSASDRFASGIGSIRNRYLGNEGALRQAITDPVRRAASENLGRVERGVGLRRMSGSTFGQQDISNERFRGAREISNAEAFAMDETLKAELGLNQAELDAITNAAMQRSSITGEALEIAKMRVMQELNILGIGSDTQGVNRFKNQEFQIDASFGTGKGGGGGTP